MKLSKSKWILFFLFSWISICHAEVYKWTDPNGVIHFSDQPNDSSNTEKIKIINNHSSYDSNSVPITDDTIVGYMDDLMEKAKEIKNEADECYYIADNKKELDISCKNYSTLLNRDFNPLIKKIKDYLSDNPKIKISQKELDEIHDIVKDANEKYLQAINYMLYVLQEKANETKRQAYSCYSYAIENNALDTSCQIYQRILNQEFNPLLEKVKDYVLENPEIDISKKEKALDELNNIIFEADDYYKRAMTYIAAHQGKI
ncbi:hypothetical protein Lste_3393 [Legionella steelei]|uniref:DUF4124 domain-containing protein n=1 Tax=Legionella steelei TaxID=947033 RepID=A0A0W0ZEQ1_9GAMM|nr:DUF4124 domain-containing protein [Legionella steelei]KTD67187.1 hypothetical protein Lste_3393 [Legionella steelei]